MNNSSNPKFYFHIGTHKTGSTTLQRWLDENSSMLGAQGFEYPEHYRNIQNPNQRHDHRYLPAILRKQEHEYPSGLTLSFSSEHAHHVQATIFSSENFWHINDVSQVEALRVAIGNIESCVLAFLRNPANHLISLWKELLKTGFSKNFQDFVEISCPIKGGDISYYSYESKLELWGSSGFDLIVLDYDAAAKQEATGIIKTFSQAIQLSLPEKVVLPSDGSVVNSSMSDIQALFLLYANQITSNNELLGARRHLKKLILSNQMIFDTNSSDLESVSAVEGNTDNFMRLFHLANPNLSDKYGIMSSQWNASKFHSLSSERIKSIVRAKAIKFAVKN